MTSILTNTSSMVALQTLRTISSGISQVQSEISTGKTVSTAKDNAAIWAISKVMESDVKGFKGISDSLSLASSTLTVAREATESISDLLTTMKQKIVTAQGENVDRAKLQTDISTLRDQISGIVGTAQFSGLNLVSGTDDAKFLAAIDRTGTTVNISDITVKRQDMSFAAGEFGSGASLSAAATVGASGQTGAFAPAGNALELTFTDLDELTSSGTIQFSLGSSQISFTKGATLEAAITAGIADKINAMQIDGISAAADGANKLVITSTKAFADVAVKDLTVSDTGDTAFTITKANGVATDEVTAPGSTTANSIQQRGVAVTFAAGSTVNAGDSYRINLGTDIDADYIAGKGETMKDVVNGLSTAINGKKIDGLTTSVRQDAETGAWVLSVDSNTAGNLTVSGAAGGKASGGLFGLDQLDVTTTQGARAALQSIEVMINNSVDAAAEFGSAQNRVITQKGFIDSLTDAMTAGIGSLVDADMEEASARLQALQVQQQLGIQALSIANQQSQNLMSLFR